MSFLVSDFRNRRWGFKPSCKLYPSGTIRQCYEHAGIACPLAFRAYSSRAQAFSTAFYRGVPLHKVCRTAAWFGHYMINVDTQRDVAVGRIVLHSDESSTPSSWKLGTLPCVGLHRRPKTNTGLHLTCNCLFVKLSTMQVHVPSLLPYW